MSETWRAIFDGSYEVSSFGNMRRAKPGRKTFAGRPLTPIALRNGYRGVRPVLNGKNVQFYVHELVALAFLGPRTGERVHVNHIDGDKHNNAAANLEYVTHAENMAHAARIGLMARGERHPGSRLTADNVREIRRLRSEGVPLPIICARFGIARSTASLAANGRNWRHVT